MNDPRAEYARRLALWDIEIARGARQHHLLANCRLMVVAITAVGVWAIVSRGLTPWALAGPIGVFALLAWFHDRVLASNERAKRARAIYERGMSRLDGTWASGGSLGQSLDMDRARARDLDLVGSGSLFQLLSVARTEAGEVMLGQWLNSVPLLDEIRARQSAVDELRPMIDFRESLAVTISNLKISRTGVLARWAETNGPAVGATARAVFTTLTAISIALTLGEILGFVPPPVLVMWLVAQGGIAMISGGRMLAMLGGLDQATADLTLLKVLLERIEEQQFSSPYLQALGASLTTDGRRASQHIAQLERLVTALDTCRNQLVLPIAILFQVQAHLAMAIDRWRVREAPAIAVWLRTVGTHEALASLSTFAFEHPADPFPDVTDGEPHIHAEGLGHPLIAETVAVRNDVAVGGSAPHLLMVSGSNMSGKSTLMRAIGVNVVLAMAGAPVRATSMRVSRLTLGTSMRVEDSLQDGQSRFYAEILRLKAVLELASGQPPVVFLLDEVLSGTNSHDRRVGAEAVIRSLLAAGAAGLVTTHDLALTELVDTAGASAANVHFDDRVEGDRMIFDYKMRPGVVERSNALELMRAIGIKIK